MDVKQLDKQTCLDILNTQFNRNLFLHQLQTLVYAKDKKEIALFMKMRTGKSAVVINWLKLNNIKDNILIITVNFPLCANWIEEFNIDYPELKGVILKGSKQERINLLYNHYDYYLINYDGLLVIPDLLLSKTWNAIILDESRRIKNPFAKRTQIALELSFKAQYRAILSGTPFVHLLDIFTQYFFVFHDKVYGDNYYSFRNKYFYDQAKLNNIVYLLPYYSDTIIANTLKVSIKYVNQIRQVTKIEHNPKLKPKPFLKSKKYLKQDWVLKEKYKEEFLKKFHSNCIIFEKEEVLDLPPKTYDKLYIDLSEEQRRDYLRLLQGSNQLKITKLSFLELENIFIKYLQIINGFIKIDNDIYFYKENPKLNTLIDLIIDNVDNTKIVVYHNFIIEGQMIERELKKYDIKYASMRSEIKDTTEEYNKFRKDDSVRVMVAHPASGGIGLNFIVSSMCIYYNLGYNLENILQSEERLHGPGQTKNVEYIYLLMKNTIDEHLYAMKQARVSFINYINNYTFVGEILKTEREENI